MVDKGAGGNVIQRVEFTYDAFSRRIAKAVGVSASLAPLQWFVYNGDDVHLEFTDNDGTAGANQPVLSQRYLHGPDVDQVLAQEDGNGNVIWMLTDHLGTIRDLVDNSGAVVNHLVYDSFGRVISESDPSVDTRYLYTGREFDEETNLYYYRARYYDSKTGRFISQNPIFESGESNLYRYVTNESVSFTDPFGETRQKGKKNVRLSDSDPIKQKIDKAIQENNTKALKQLEQGNLNKEQRAYLKTETRKKSFGKTGRPTVRGTFRGVGIDPVGAGIDFFEACKSELELPQRAKEAGRTVEQQKAFERQQFQKELDEADFIQVPGFPFPIVNPFQNPCARDPKSCQI